MTRFALLFAVVLATGCATKPSADDCRKAIANMQRLMGTDNMRDDGRIEGEVRRCKGGSTKKAVDCAIKAQSLDDLRHCEFFKVPENAKGLGGDVGSGAAAPAGSAGSAVAPAAGSAAAPDTGSARATTGSGSAAAPPPAAGVGSAK